MDGIGLKLPVNLHAYWSGTIRFYLPGNGLIDIVLSCM